MPTTHSSDATTWIVDETAAAQVMAWIRRNPAVFRADLQAMATYFPHWLLVGAKNSKPVICPTCRNLVVPKQGAMRCMSCNASVPAQNLLWVGQIPALAREEPKFAAKRQALSDAGFAEVTTSGQTFLLVPLTVEYASEYPNEQPEVRYNLRWLDALGLPHSHGGFHIIGSGQACIFGYNQWYAMTVANLLQQRMVNHIASLLKIAAGQSANQAFIGRIH